ncbi:hypothetical protein SPFL3102_02116 [Sporomusaceae bacterium FL31]|nr:hypothetical protein SPFL3101_03750 [Sporomusaceae bacterium FL31]GCE34305.1 hypothetical protein SPFL3102_02116 [Sporomusaceae bacterium]
MFGGSGPWGAGRWCGLCLGGGGLVNAVVLGIGVYALTRLLLTPAAKK